MAATYYSGIYVHDTKGQITIRWSTNTPHYSAMCVWDNMLVLGNGESATAHPNLVYASWSSYDEETEIVGNTSTTANLYRVYRTKAFDCGDPLVSKQLRKIVVRWRNDDSWAAGSTMLVKYRVNPVRNFSQTNPTFTTLATITSNSDATDDGVHVKSYPCDNLSVIFNTIQFEFSSGAAPDDTKTYMDIISVDFYFDVLSEKYE